MPAIMNKAFYDVELIRYNYKTLSLGCYRNPDAKFNTLLNVTTNFFFGTADSFSFYKIQNFKTGTILRSLATRKENKKIKSKISEKKTGGPTQNEKQQNDIKDDKY